MGDLCPRNIPCIITLRFRYKSRHYRKIGTVKILPQLSSLSLHCTFYAFFFFFFVHKIPSTLAIRTGGWRGWIEAGHSRELKSFWSSESTNFLLMENFQIHPSHTQCQAQGSVRTCLTFSAENSARQSCKIFNGRSLQHPYNILLIILKFLLNATLISVSSLTDGNIICALRFILSHSKPERQLNSDKCWIV